MLVLAVMAVVVGGRKRTESSYSSFGMFCVVWLQDCVPQRNTETKRITESLEGVGCSESIVYFILQEKQ